MFQTELDLRNRLLVARLPAMPQILLKLIELCQADEAGMGELAKLIANDAGMTAKIMTVANSAAYHRGDRKVSLVQALGVLGADMIKTLVISESIYQTFNAFPHTGSTDLRCFWKHALTIAVMAREIAKKMDYPQAEEAYLAGLLHDVGRLALLAAAPREYGANFLAQDNDHLCALELRTLQISHTEAGAWLLERWNLDSFMADSILYHHEAPQRLESAHPLIRIIHLANWLGNQPLALPLETNAGALCQISDDDLLAISQGAAAQVKKAADYLGINLAGVDDLAAPVPAAVPLPEPNPAQERLTNEVRNMALTAELAQSFARQKGDTQLLDVARQNAQLLFNLDDSIIFLMNGSGQALMGVSMGERLQRLSELSISLSGGGGIAGSALQKRVVFPSRDQGLTSLSEDQLLRMLGAEVLVCIPLVSGVRCLGVLVSGIPAWRVADLKSNEKFLQSFGAQIATALESSTQDRGEIDRRIASVREEHLANSRKVAHEVNNPLAIIKNYLGVLDAKLGRQEPVTAELSILNEEIDRVGSIISEFAGNPVKPQQGGTDINRVIQDLVRLFRESKFLPSTVQIIERLPAQTCEIDAPANTLKQILVNLMKNAVEAMPKGGLIAISHNGRILRDGQPYVELRVKDTGTGIPAEVMAGLYSPVRSAKVGDNRGLGLSIVHGLVTGVKGQINCQSSKAGTEFEILLPARQMQAQSSAATLARDTA
jgi:putative nucleotidyltransferase with HDIG domain